MSSPSPYHHGDLRSALLQEADVMLKESGIAGLSLRQLAERVGVSRMAPYHHFRDKHELLCALATEGFRQLDSLLTGAEVEIKPNTESDHSDAHNRLLLEKVLSRVVRDYLHFATTNPDRYELMFGRPIWQAAKPSQELKDTAFACFRRYADSITSLLAHSPLQGRKPLRLAQASWATLHGMARLIIDGIYIHQADMEEVSDEAVRMMLAVLSSAN